MKMRGTNKHTEHMNLKIRGCEERRLQASTQKLKDIRMQGCKQGHITLRIRECREARIKVRTHEHKDMRMRGCEDTSYSTGT